MPSTRDAGPTIRFVDDYCHLFVDLFPQVRSYEAFKFLPLGMISDIKRKSLPAIAGRFDETQLESVRTLLNTPFDLDLITVSQFTYGPWGNRCCSELAKSS